MTKKKGILLGSLAVFALVLIYVLYRFNYLPHPKYSNEKFGIETYRSQVDRDGDGGYGLPRARCALAMTVFLQGTGARPGGSSGRPTPTTPFTDRTS